MMKIIKEVITAGLLWSHVNDAVISRRNDLLKMQIATFKFRNDRIEILDVNGDRPAGRGVKLGWFEFMVLHRERQGDRIVGAPDARIEQQRTTD